MNRRKFIIISSHLGAATVLGFSSLSGCSEKDPCDDLSTLSEDDKKERKSYNYLKKSPYQTKTCTNCEFWIDPEEETLPCGNCALFEGSVHPNGYCDGWSLLDA